MRFRASEQEAGLRLDAVVAARAGLGSRSAAQRLIEHGLVTVNGSPRPKSHRLAVGERVEVATPPLPEGGDPELTVEFGVAYEDEHLLVVDKPAGLVVHPGAGRRQGTLAQALAGRAAGGEDPDRRGVVHRLDRDTSGLLVVAKSEAAYEALSRAIREREVTRGYLALVSGRPGARTATIDAPLGRDRHRRTLVSTETDQPREAVTHFKVLDALPRTTLLAVTLETGRTHQIRAHLSAIDHPVCGDPRYGGMACGRRLGLDRQFLHANVLGFSHPVTREALMCESKPPTDLRRALDTARWEPASEGPDGG